MRAEIVRLQSDLESVSKLCGHKLILSRYKPGKVILYQVERITGPTQPGRVGCVALCNAIPYREVKQFIAGLVACAKIECERK
jgi:hypothetical protein